MSSVPPLWDGWGQPTKPSESLELGLAYARMEGMWCTGELFRLRNVPDEPPHRSWMKEFVAGEKFSWDQKCHCEACLAKKAYRAKLEETGLTCTDVQACAVGILIMSTLDGPAVNAYFYSSRLEYYMRSLGINKRSRLQRLGRGFVEELLVEDKVGGPACLFLHAGMVRLWLERSVELKRKEQDKVDDDDAAWEFRPTDPVKMIESFIAGPQRGPRGGKPRDVRLWRREVLSDHKSCVISFNDSGSTDPEDEVDEDDAQAIPHTKGEKYHDLIAKSFEYAVEFAKEYEGRMGFEDNAEPVKV